MRRIRKNKYALAGILTMLVFTSGLLLGLVIIEYKLDYIQQLSKTQSADYVSLQFQYNYIENLETSALTKEEKCNVLSATLENNLKLLSPALEKLEAYELNGDIKNGDYILLKREYTIANLRYWILSEKNKKVCDSDTVSILYFHTQDCPICNDQGYILSQIKKIFKDQLLIFPMDISINEPAIDVLKKQYHIQTYPTIIIDGKTIETNIDKIKTLEEICPIYKNNTIFGVC